MGSAPRGVGLFPEKAEQGWETAALQGILTVLQKNSFPWRYCSQVKPALSQPGRALAPCFLSLPRAGKPWGGKLSFRVVQRPGAVPG